MRAILLSLAPCLAAGLRRAPPYIEGIGAFQSDNGLYCGQSDSRTVEAALALKKAGPYGKNYIRAIAWKSTCEGLNYTIFGGEDACYPGLQTYYRNDHERAHYAMLEGHLVTDFSSKHGIRKAQVALLAACSCHPQSIAMRGVQERCASLDSIRGSWIHKHPTSGKSLICVEGPFSHAVYSLASLKASIQLPMHAFDQVQAFNCTTFGFTEMYNQPDHCYPKMRLWTKTAPIHLDAGIKESNEVEDHLFRSNDFIGWAQKEHRNARVLHTTPGCNCVPDSEVGKRNAPTCSVPARRPPINDWYTG